MLSINAHAMTTSLGCDAATACAAARAGLSRAGEIAGMKFTFDVTGEPEPLIGHAVPLLTRGFEGQARLQRLLFGGLSELKKQLIQAELKAPIGFYLSLPDPARTVRGLDLIASDGARAVYTERADDLGTEPTDVGFAHDLLASAAAQAGWPTAIDLRHVSFAGHAGGAQCIAAAQRDLDTATIATAIVGASDSLLDEATVTWLHSSNRLKYSGMPVGLMPGEACAFLALSKAGQEPDGEITGVAIGLEPKTLWSGGTSVGEGLANALEQVADRAAWKQNEPAWVISDQNGEAYRANELGHVLARLRAAWPALEGPTVWTPAGSFGDTGCASAIVAVCMALQAFKRAYAPAESVVVISSSEADLRAALTVTSRHTSRR
jgi:3-oxoacyl-[acyl-carrier-protein] synthase I